MIRVPFFVRRPWLLLRDLAVDRERPDLGKLRSIEDPEAFVWAILPHAARTFSACIALLPEPTHLGAAVAYLYCRILDTYEDLLPDQDAREAALRAFHQRLDAHADGAALAAAPTIGDVQTVDERDRAHLLLVERCALVDATYRGLDDGTRAITRDLVRDMAEGMCWSSRTFAEQGGVLVDEEQLAQYCRHVLGNPVVFTVRLMRHRRTGEHDLSDDVREDCMRSGELIQLANVTRDIEKDLRRGVAYHPLLRPDLRTLEIEGDVAERVRSVRRELLAMALDRAPSYRRMVAAMAPGSVSIARTSALLMLLFTDRYYSGCAARVGLSPWIRRASGMRLLLRALPGTWSRASSDRTLSRVERDFAAAAAAASRTPTA